MGTNPVKLPAEIPPDAAATPSPPFDKLTAGRPSPVKGEGESGSGVSPLGQTRRDAASAAAGDPLQRLAIAVEESLTTGEPLPAIGEGVLSETERSRLESIAGLVKSLHRLREPAEVAADDPDRDSLALSLAAAGTGTRHFGRFEIERLLGYGGHGVVYLAFDPILKRQVALKIPRPEVLVDPNLRERFLREARSAAMLDHPNIVPIYEAGTTGDVCFIAMAYCSGGSLAEFLAHQPGVLSPRGWARLFKALAEALEFTHSRGILHRDLKPSNILLFPAAEVAFESHRKRPAENATDSDASTSPSPRPSPIKGEGETDSPPFVPKLTDFGLAKLVEEFAVQTRTSMTIGTPLYMSPEQAGHRPDEADARCDIHALGVILYESLTGKTPFEAPSVLAVLEAVRQREPPAPHKLDRLIPRDLSTICMKCMEKRPGKRYQRAADLAADLGRFLNHEPIEARQAALAGRLFLWCQRRPAAAGFIALSMMAFVGALVGYLLHRNQVADLDALNRASAYSRLVNETEAMVARPRVGWSSAGLDRLRETLIYEVPERDVVSLRSAATAFLAGADLQEVGSIAAGIQGYCVAFNREGSQVAIGDNIDGDTGEVRVDVWDFATRKQHWRLTFPVATSNGRGPDGVRSLIYTRDGRHLVAGSRRGMIDSWDLTTSPPTRREWHDATGWVTSLVELPGGEILAGSDDGALRRLDLTRGQLTSPQKFEYLICDLRTGVLRTGDGAERAVLAASVGETLRLLTWPGAEPMPHWRSPFPPGRLLGPFIDRSAILVARERSVDLIDLEHERILRTFIDGDVGTTHDSEVRSIDLSPDGHLMASGAGDGRVKLWDMASGKLLSNLFLSAADNIAVKFHPDGRHLVAANGLETRILAVNGGSIASVTGLQRSIISAMGSAEGRLITLGQTDNPEITAPPSDTASNARLISSGEATAASARKVPHADVKMLSTNGAGDERSEPSLCDQLRRPISVVVHPNRPGWVCFGGGYFAELRLDDQRREFFQDQLQAVDFSEDGNNLWATYSVKIPEFDKPVGAVGAWRLSNLSKAAEWINLESRRKGLMNGLYALAVGKTWLAAASTDETVKLFRPETPKLELVVAIPTEGDEVESLTFNPEESLLAIGTRRGNLILVRPGEDKKVYQNQCHADTISSAAFNSDGRLLATGSYDHSVRLWLVRNDRLEPILSLPQQSNRILKVAFGPRDDTLFVLVQNETAVRTFRLKQLKAALGQFHLDWQD